MHVDDLLSLFASIDLPGLAATLKKSDGTRSTSADGRTACFALRAACRAGRGLMNNAVMSVEVSL